MKRHVQLEGVRKWAGDHLLELQSEPLQVLDRFFGQYGPYVLQGCEVTPAVEGNELFDVAPGLVVLAGKDRNNDDAVMVVPFAGGTGFPLPLYLTLAWDIRRHEYVSGGVKPIAYDYYAAGSTVQPAAGTPHLLLNARTLRFVDKILPDRANYALQNGTYPNFTAGNSLKLGGRPASDYVLREDLRDGFKVTDISGWTTPITTTGSQNPITAQVTKPWRDDVMYVFSVSISGRDAEYSPPLILGAMTRTLRFDSIAAASTYMASCLDSQTITMTVGTAADYTLFKVYEISPKTL